MLFPGVGPYGPAQPALNRHPEQITPDEAPSDADEPPSTETALSPAPDAAADWMPLATPSTPTLLIGLTASIVAAATFSALSTSLLRALPTHQDESPAPEPGGYPGSTSMATGTTGRTEVLAASAGILAFVARAAAAVIVFTLALALFEPTAPSAMRFLKALAVTGAAGGLALHLLTMSIPLALAQNHAAGIVRVGLPSLSPLLTPMTWVAKALAVIRRILLRAIGTPDASHDTRRLVEGFRAIVEDAEMHGDLGAETRALIANVIEFGEADAAEVMTPRTEIEAIEADASLVEAIAVFAASGFSRIPVYVETIDTIIGTLTALEAAKAVAEDRVAKTSIRSVMRPPLLVPETQLVPELLGAFRKQRQKMAIVVDEYGGTAGLVTLADVMAEIVGHVQDEFEAEEAPPFKRLGGGRVEADASQHVADINELASLSIPEEEDYETLAGFVLAEFGRFPLPGDAFSKDGVTYEVSEATDRRVLRVILERPVDGIVLTSDVDTWSPQPDEADSKPEGAGDADTAPGPEAEPNASEDRETSSANRGTERPPLAS